MSTVIWKRSIALRSASLACALLLAGCAGFFVKPTSTGSSGSSGSTTVIGDFAYVSNSASGSTYLNAYNLASGTLSAISGSPLNLGFTPAAMAVAPSNSFLYVASTPGAVSSGIYLYSISSTGALTAANSGSVLIGDQISSIAISPDGGWLFSLNVTGLILSEYQVNTSTGSLALATTFSLPGVGCVASAGGTTPSTQTCAITAGPSGNYVAAALGTAGTVIFPYASSSGLSATGSTLISTGSSTASPSGDFAVTLDKNNYAYIARTNTLAVYAPSSGAATLQATATFALGTVPRSPLLNSSYNYVYIADEGVSAVSGFGIGASGTLAEVTGSPFSAPASVAALGADNSGKYVIAAGYDGTSGIQLFTIGTGGGLTLTGSTASGTSLTIPAILAFSH